MSGRRVIPMSELEPYPDGSPEIAKAQALYNVLGTKAIEAVVPTASGLLVSAGRLSRNSLSIVSNDAGYGARYAVVISSKDFPTLAVLRNMVCAPNYPMDGLADVAGVEEIDLVTNLVDGTRFNQGLSYLQATGRASEFDSLMEDMFGPDTRLASFDIPR